ncbi:EAL domain, c-di-GMP-specific phosphodiesterase class I (or its enzymatically inactive variant) [Asanoa hainanensis]|uniref:EAL domain, c-di-GMP-specific phosphodiesterase class I (Or its enzymatically inactive variant) n=1 Tax=Asanoa hainanensis TaxID=560556 RepID=A0A239PEW8_9ACTN|nr:EAL domain, c-di-GMP-specific phosphodiesterase class I (or its enzymatically inactive variant) [Asanoa hainanensis]
MALIVGVNDCGSAAALPSLRYAESDARAVHKALTDPVAGGFAAADAFLLTGAEADGRSIRDQLRALTEESTSSDTLFVYFAGHALTANWNGIADDYLVTPELGRVALNERPDDGLRMAFLRGEVLDTFKGIAFLVVDWRHAGSYIGGGAEKFEMMRVGGRHSKQHNVLLAAPHEGGARESETLGHGLLTKHLLDALAGKAANSEGLVTFGGLADYVAGLRLEPQPDLFVQSRGTTAVLTRPGRGASDGAVVDPLPANVRIVDLANPLERSAAAIVELLGRVFPRHGAFGRPPTSSTTEAFGATSEGPQPARKQEKIELMRVATEADAAALLEYTSSGFVTISETRHFREDDLHYLMRGTAQYSSFPLRSHVLDGTSAGRVLCVPLRHGLATSLVLVVVNPAQALLDIGEPLAKILEAIWATDLSGPVEEGEIAVLTALRESFGRLPPRLYSRCFELYRQVVGSFSMVFQPIVAIDERQQYVDIHSYEALARLNAADPRAPRELIRLAHVWGDQFVVARDEAILRKAIQSYAEAHRRCYGDNAGAPRPVSINVAVRSLLSDSYVDEIERTIRAAGLRPSAVTLEISEQDPIEPRAYEIWGDDKLGYFHERLVAIADRLDVRFAVDDFGVEHSSVSRMAELPLTQIKVDRALLRHPLAYQELELVAKVARHPVKIGQSPARRSVVVEGVEDDSPISLEQIYGLGIRHVQGFITGERPSSTIKREIDREMRERLASLVRGNRAPLRRSA